MFKRISSTQYLLSEPTWENKLFEDFFFFFSLIMVIESYNLIKVHLTSNKMEPLNQSGDLEQP